MSGIIDSVKSAFAGSVPHETPRVTQTKRILLAVTGETVQMPDHRSGFFWGELLHPYEVITKAGYDVDIVSESGRAIPDESSITSMASASDKKKWEDKQFPLHAKLAAIRAAHDIQNPSVYTAIYYAGGHAACADLPTASGLQKLTAAIYETGGVVGADCHGIAVFDNLRLSTGAPLVQGKRVTGFSEKGEEAMKVMDWMRQHGFKTMRQVVEGNGGIWEEHKSNPMAEFVVADARLVTGMNPASAAKVAQDMLAILPRTTNDPQEQAINAAVPAGVGQGDAVGKIPVPDNAKEYQRTYAGEAAK